MLGYLVDNVIKFIVRGSVILCVVVGCIYDGVVLWVEVIDIGIGFDMVVGSDFY